MNLNEHFWVNIYSKVCCNLVLPLLKYHHYLKYTFHCQILNLIAVVVAIIVMIKKMITNYFDFIIVIIITIIDLQM